MNVELLEVFGNDLMAVNVARTKTNFIILETYNKGYRINLEGKLLNPENKEINFKLYGKKRYPTFSINYNKKPYGIPVHLFAAYCFYKEESFLKEFVVRHLDGNVLNVSFKNIKLGTHSQNNLDKCPIKRKLAARKARLSQGDKFLNKKLSIQDVKFIRQEYSNLIGKTPKGFILNLMNKFNVSKPTIFNVIHYKNYNSQEYK